MKNHSNTPQKSLTQRSGKDTKTPDAKQVELKKLHADYHLIPVDAKGKHPTCGKWLKYRTEKYPYEKLRHQNGWAIITGLDGLEVIDIDSREPAYDAGSLLSAIKSTGIADGCPVIKTQSGGFHIYIRSDHAEGAKKLANRTLCDENGEIIPDKKTGKPQVQSIVETKGVGGYTLAPPTKGYEVVQGNILHVPKLTKEQRAELLDVCRSLNEVDPTPEPETWRKDKPGDNSNAPGTLYNEDPDSLRETAELLKANGWKSSNNVHFTRPGKKSGISATLGKVKGKFYVFSSSASPFEMNKSYSPFAVYAILKHGGDFSEAAKTLRPRYKNPSKKARKSTSQGEQSTSTKKDKAANLEEVAERFIRVGCDYYKKIKKTDAFGIPRKELIPWKKSEITEDYGKGIIRYIPKYDSFTLNFDYQNFKQTIDGHYNRAAPLPWQPKRGEIPVSQKVMEHLFGDQLHLGWRYMQLLYLHPHRQAPILCPVSREKGTGKTTIMSWFQMIYGHNATKISPQDLDSSFNSSYADKNLIICEETNLKDKIQTTEKLKELSTAYTITVNEKHITNYQLPFYGRIIITSNHVDKFVKIDEEEIRFFVRELGKPEYINHKNILEELKKEIPAFLHYLKELPAIDFSVSRDGFTPEELRNPALTRLKEESKGGLYQTIKEYFRDFFMNDGADKDSTFACILDIKKKFFERDNSVNIKHIRYVVKIVLKKEPEKNQRYVPFGDYNNERVGKPYQFLKSEFLSDEEVNETREGEIGVPF